MDFLKSLVPSWMNSPVYMGGVAVLLLALIYFVYRWFTGSKSSFSDMGEACNPQIENACGKDANCHPDENGEKGICFPKEEEPMPIPSESESENVEDGFSE
jgi:hypothetical protein